MAVHELYDLRSNIQTSLQIEKNKKGYMISYVLRYLNLIK